MGTELVSLDVLADRINAKMADVEAAHRNALEQAKEAGDLLIEAKEQVQHGKWLPWLEAHCHVSADMAGKWMKLAREWPRLVATHSERVPYLGVKEAVRLLAKPRKAKEEDSQPHTSTTIIDVEATEVISTLPPEAPPSVEALVDSLEAALLELVSSERAKAVEATIERLYGFLDENCKDRMTLVKMREAFPRVGAKELRKEVVNFLSYWKGAKISQDRDHQEGIAADYAEDFIRRQKERGWQPGRKLVSGVELHIFPTE